MRFVETEIVDANSNRIANRGNRTIKEEQQRQNSCRNGNSQHHRPPEARSHNRWDQSAEDARELCYSKAKCRLTFRETPRNGNAKKISPNHTLCEKIGKHGTKRRYGETNSKRFLGLGPSLHRTV